MSTLIKKMDKRIDELSELASWFTLEKKETFDRLIIFQGLIKTREDRLSSGRVSSIKQFLKIDSNLKEKISYKVTKDKNIIVKYLIWEDKYE